MTRSKSETRLISRIFFSFITHGYWSKVLIQIIDTSLEKKWHLRRPLPNVVGNQQQHKNAITVGK